MSVRESTGSQQLRDLNVGAVFSKEDAEYVQRNIQRDKFDTFNERLIRRFNGQTSYDDQIHKTVEPLEVQVKEDLVVSAGQTRIAQLCTGISTTSFTHFAAGSGQTAESAAQIALVTEVGRVSMATSGDRFVSGTSMKFAGFFPSTTPTATIWEGGVFDASSGGTMLLRAKYAASLGHTSGATVFTLNSTVLQTAS